MNRALAACLFGIVMAASLRYMEFRLALAKSVNPVSHVWDMIGFAVHVAVYFCLLGLLVWPLRSHRRATLVAAGGAVGIGIFTVSLLLLALVQIPEPVVGITGQVALLFVLTVLPLWLTVLLRNRWWPRTTDHCQRCDYNLTGLPEPRCPECGTEFDPATVAHGPRDETEDN